MKELCEAYEKKNWHRAEGIKKKHKWECKCEGKGCSTEAQCYQNARAHIAVSDYFDRMKPKEVIEKGILPKLNSLNTRCHRNSELKCASGFARHKVRWCLFYVANNDVYFRLIIMIVECLAMSFAINVEHSYSKARVKGKRMGAKLCAVPEEMLTAKLCKANMRNCKIHLQNS